MIIYPDTKNRILKPDLPISSVTVPGPYSDTDGLNFADFSSSLLKHFVPHGSWVLEQSGNYSPMPCLVVGSMFDKFPSTKISCTNLSSTLISNKAGGIFYVVALSIKPTRSGGVSLCNLLNCELVIF